MKTLIPFLSFLFVSHSALASLDPVLDAADRRLPEAESISRAVSDPAPTRRALAAQALGEIMSVKGADALLKLSTDPVPLVRQQSAFALGQLGWLPDSSAGKEAAIQKRLSELLQDRQGAIRNAATEALGKMGGTEAEKLLLPALSSFDSSTRALAVMALFRARMILKLRDPEHPPGPISDSLRERLLKLSDDKSPAVKQSVAYFFARNSEPKVEASMAKLTHEKNTLLRLFSVMALGKMKAKSSKDELGAALHDPEYSVRTAAVTALAASGENILPFASSLLSDKSFHVRAATVAAFSGERKEEAALLKQTLASDPSPTVKAEAFKALAKSKKGAELWDFLVSGIKSPLWQLREAAVQSSEPLEGENKEKFLQQEAASEGNRLVRASALEAWFSLPTPDAFAQLKLSLESKELSERATAVGALKERKEPEITDLAWKTYQNSLDSRWVETREDLLEVFIKNTSDVTTAYLKQALLDPDRSVQAKARKALQNRGATDLPSVPEAELSFSPFRELSFRKNPRVEVQTSRGKFVVECFAQDAPIHVADFVGHVKGGFYDGLEWHRVISNFVIQGGDPDGTGFGGAGYALRAEINRHPFARGALGMPRSQGFDTGGGQLFFSHIPTPHLEGQYTVFGQVVSGLEVIDLIERGDKILQARVLP